MAPASAVGSHIVFEKQDQKVGDNAILAGPVKTVTIADVTGKMGARFPDAAHSQKRFRVATILVTAGALVSPDAMRFYDSLAARGGAKQQLPDAAGLGMTNPFRLATKGRPFDASNS